MCLIESKIYFQIFSDFNFSSYGENSSKIDNFEYKSDHMSKIKKIWKLIFHSFQNIARHFGPTKENGFFWRGCVSLIWTDPQYHMEFRLLSNQSEKFNG